MRTEVGMNLPFNPKTKYIDKNIEINKLLLDENHYTYYGGDGTVSTANTIAPMLKWAYDRPIHMVDYCNEYMIRPIVDTNEKMLYGV